MAGKRKKHLRYQAKKQSYPNAISTTEEKNDQTIAARAKPNSRREGTRKSILDKKGDTKKAKQIASRLSAVDITFIRSELKFIIFIFLVITASYLLFWLIFRTTQLDEGFYRLIELGQKK
ncbi:hypothetical protein KBC99_01480 [Candidatus Saccharibacteria bacterium]|nr:hypothetical protein [Candidatus Saccharibacteria bacterium]